MSETFRKIRGPLSDSTTAATERRRVQYRVTKKCLGKDIEKRAYQLLTGSCCVILLVLMYIASK